MNAAMIPLTQGNLNNNHFYLTSCLAMFPADSIGGRNINAHATRSLQLHPLGGELLETDIDGEKNIFRKRGWVATMFKQANAKLGDHVCINKNENGSYEVWVAKSGDNS